MIRTKLVNLATSSGVHFCINAGQWRCFLMEATIGTVMPTNGKLVINNGAYGQRIGQIARYLKIDHRIIKIEN